MTGTPLSLLLSLLFGLGQVIVGAMVVLHGIRQQRWRRPGVFVLMVAGAWFVVSGVTELFVSGMESLRMLVGSPSLTTFTFWRGRADAALFTASLLLAVVALLYAALWRWYLRSLVNSSLSDSV